MPNKLSERTNGNGKVFADQQFLADCQYEVRVYQRLVDTTNVGLRATSLSDVKVGQIDVRILSTSVPLQVDSRKRLTLHLEDGRKLDFYWLHGNPTATEGLY
jgi:hypothetical protein